MADNTNYIGVAFGLDVTDLKAGLEQTSKMIGTANAEFRSVSSGMDDWTKSVEGITAKVSQLDTVLSAQKSKLAGLTAEYERVAKEQGASSVEAQNLYIKLKNQQAVVNTTERELNNYKETLEGVENGTIDLEEVTLKGGKAVDKLGDEAKESGGSLDGLKGIMGGVVGAVAALGAAVVAAVGSFLALAESTREAREDMAKLNSAFEGAKLSSESAEKTFTSLFGVIGETDTAVEAAQQIALLAESEEQAAKWAEQAANVTATFGDALKPETFFEAANETIKLGEATGAFTQMLEGTGVNVDEFNAHLASLNTEQEKQAYMLEVSQKAMGDAGAAYRETAGDIIAAREAEAELSLAMQELGAIAEPIMTSLKLVAVDLLEAIKPFVELIGEGLQGALDGTAGATDKLAEGVGGLLTSITDKIVELFPFLIETVVSLVGTLLPQVISTLAAQLPLLLQSIISGFSQIMTELGNMLPTLIPLIIDAILMIVETLLDNIDQIIDAGIALIMGLADGLIQALPILVSKIPVIIEKLVDAIVRNLPKILRAGVQLLLSLREGITDAIPDLLAMLPSLIGDIVAGLISLIPELISCGADLIAGLFEGMLNFDIWGAIKKLGSGIVDGFKSFFGIHSPSKLIEDEIGQYLGEGVGVGVLDSIPTVKKQLGKFGDFITDNLGGIKAGLDISANGTSANGSGRGVGGNTVINAGMTVNYNGNLSRRQVRQLENDNYSAIRLRLVKEGAI